MGLNVSGFLILYKFLDLFKIYVLEHTEAIMYLTYIITRKICNIISDCTVSDFISDHRVLLASLQCIRPHPVRKQICIRALRRIKDDALDEDLERVNVDQGCVDVYIMIEQYDKYVSDLLAIHAPKKNICGR